MGLYSYLAFRCFIIQAMVISAQVVDMFVAKVGGHSYALDFEHMKIARTIRGLGGDPQKLAWCDTTWHSNGRNFVDCGPAQSTWVISLGKVADKAHTKSCTPISHRLLQSRRGMRGITLRPRRSSLRCNDSLVDVISAPQGT